MERLKKKKIQKKIKHSIENKKKIYGDQSLTKAEAKKIFTKKNVKK
jgi:hypothetical protein